MIGSKINELARRGEAKLSDIDANRTAPMRIALLGWGSLLWEGGAGFDKCHDEWNPDGPQVPLEFSRISKRRLGALTLVIDHEHGAPTTVAWCFSIRRRVEDAIYDLRSREETTVENIGRLALPEALHPVDGDERNDAVVDPMAVWARNKGIDVVIWTALASNFTSKAKCPFSVSAAIAYLKTLPPEAKAKAAEYVWRAPDFVQTPLRRALQQEPWFAVPGQ